MDPMLSAAGGAVIGWLIPMVLKKTIGTRHITVRECENCEMRRAVSMIQDMVTELAIKAGVPVHEAIRAVRPKEDK